jgi:uncharacterized protein (DUF1697 family)
MKYIALLRGINIGKRTIKSDELKSCFEKAGFAGVQTVLATGNVILESGDKADKLKQNIEKLLESKFNFPVKVKVMDAGKLAGIIQNFPFQDAGSEYHRYVIFKDEQLDASELATVRLDDKLEAIQPGENVIYWRVLKGHTLDSDFARQSAKAAAKTFSTTRNLNTLEKILAKTK